MNEEQQQKTLEPLEYHKTLLEHIKSEEYHAWEWSTIHQGEEDVQNIREAMLRDTYRLEQTSYPKIFEACHTAMKRLGLDAPVTLYQANDGNMNASLVYVPKEIHIIFYGPILEKLDENELLALMGHELSHYLLWSIDDGEHYRVNRVFDHALSYDNAKPSHRETARLLSLYNESFADRGAALAAGDPNPAIAVLIKVMTGLTNVDPKAYLRQAEELEDKNGKSLGQSHPEIYLRARALLLWWKGDPDLLDWFKKHLHGPLSIESLDLINQAVLTNMTRAFLAHFLGELDIESNEISTQVKSVFPDFGKKSEEKLDLRQINTDLIDDATRDYFIALMFDLALADSDASEATMLVAAKTAAEIGATERLKSSLRRDLKWTKAKTDKLIKQAEKAS